MPSNSKHLYVEGAVTSSYRTVSGGRFNEEETRKTLYDVPGQYPGCIDTRNYEDNKSNMRAAIAANNKGSTLIGALVK